MESNVKVRLANPGDATEISRILLEAFGVYRRFYTDEAFEQVTPSPELVKDRYVEGPIWVAELDGEAVGTVSVIKEPEGLYVRSMAVSPEKQGRGVGHKLLEAVDEYAAGTDQERIFLYTTYFVPGAKEMYEKHGYERVRDTTADEWYGTPGLEMDKRIVRDKQNVIGNQ
jgi:N-acetylglutamate synthase-like GNAT family acetyltransferase